ncbi:DNA methylase N-4/N-6 domain-containing protein [Halorubrum aidingense JCM 13560]|uniref:Type II methyltransferase n=2 Tax=Halorubrum aidingense TaxID=368623 RepID=M0PC42_9EURY|nr:DNA methylase N-4/N-6 domain-containing protein [Halorubrum aidingense JCM 13560]
MSDNRAVDDQRDGEIDRWINDIHQGDVVGTLREMPESSVHCVMTSPPYYGLRDYGVDGQIGLEESLDEFVDALVDVGDELRRVLRDDGSWWLNLGDSFIEKQKTLAPHRVAIALQNAGWIVRSDAVWSKPNPMPHPVKDRLHEHKEFVFQLTPTRDYWFDLDAIRESHAESSLNRTGRNDNTERPFPGNDQTLDPDQFLHPNGKNPGDVLEVPIKSFPEAHFAVYPPELCEIPLKSSCPPKVCAVCGTPYDHTVSEPDLLANPNNRDKKARALELYEQSDLDLKHLEAARDVGLHDEYVSNHHSDGGYGKVDEEKAELTREAREVLGAYTREFSTGARTRTGWKQACDCPTVGDYTEPGIVLDPFTGAGTTALVAKRLGRRFVGIDLNPDYVALAQRRVGITVDEPERLLDENETHLAAFADGGDPGAE